MIFQIENVSIKMIIKTRTVIIIKVKKIFQEFPIYDFISVQRRRINEWNDILSLDILIDIYRCLTLAQMHKNQLQIDK